ncbi:hypothetical protein Aoc01nite_65460 [Actinoplanes octamycinicus]|nr:hypothetical protein Aoc01nite_65460 [Actinoplanes octamycinicus]
MAPTDQGPAHPHDHDLPDRAHATEVAALLSIDPAALAGCSEDLIPLLAQPATIAPGRATPSLGDAARRCASGGSAGVWRRPR